MKLFGVLKDRRQQQAAVECEVRTEASERRCDIGIETKHQVACPVLVIIGQTELRASVIGGGHALQDLAVVGRGHNAAAVYLCVFVKQFCLTEVLHHSVVLILII